MRIIFVREIEFIIQLLEEQMGEVDLEILILYGCGSRRSFVVMLVDFDEDGPKGDD